MFLNEDFLLTTEVSKKLFHDSAKHMPIIDYHCHLDPQEIYEDKNFRNITEAWLGGDHYKWRLMRACGVDEKYITGDASDYDKFMMWAKTLPKAIGNPVYAWTHLELKRFFEIDTFLDETTAPEIWEKANKLLKQKDFTRRALIKNSQVKVICTTDDPVDSLEYHKALEKEEKEFKVLPSFRPDKGLNIDDENFITWLYKLENSVNTSIETYKEFIDAIINRVEMFHENNCRLSDHALDTFTYAKASEEELNTIFNKALKGEALSELEVAKHKTAVLLELFKQYEEKNWVSQLHLKALRNNNTKMYGELGPNTGFDGINDQPIINSIRALLDAAHQSDSMPKTILYSLNANDYAPLLALMGSFQEKENNKLQLGSGWWFNDTRVGMHDQMSQFANHSVFGNFVGMLTDSRSFLSYPRHEYFRRVLCDLIGEWESRGEVYSDMDYLAKIVEDISFNNAYHYFGFDQFI